MNILNLTNLNELINFSKLNKTVKSYINSLKIDIFLEWTIILILFGYNEEDFDWVQKFEQKNQKNISKNKLFNNLITNWIPNLRILICDVAEKYTNHTIFNYEE